MFGRLSFGIAVILLIVATSMSRRQAYGEGWLNGECYLVKGGIYVGLAIVEGFFFSIDGLSQMTPILDS